MKTFIPEIKIESERCSSEIIDKVYTEQKQLYKESIEKL